MFDFNSLIGLERDEAIKLLKENNYNNITVNVNAKHQDFCDTFLVCKVCNQEDNIVLYCGEFYINKED